MSASNDPCDFQVYVGPSALSEPESQNVASILRERRVEFYVDVHSFSRLILLPWGMDSNQTQRPGAELPQPGLRRPPRRRPRRRLRRVHPAELLAEHIRIGTAMHDAILEGAGSDPRARARSDYTVQPGLALYPTTGTASDFAASLQFVDDPPAERIIAYTLEIGMDTDGEGGFQPVPAIYPKIEREVHLALMAFLSAAAAG